jgi:GNAT superfamily N-acetyltransferase
MPTTGSEAPWEIQRISSRHERKLFNCGHEALDSFLVRYARQNDEKNIGRTFVAVLAGTTKVEGYYTISSGAIEFMNLPESLRRGLARYPIPVITLGRLAVDLSVQGRGLGETLLLHALRNAWLMNKQIAAFAVLVVGKNERAKKFYLKYGFQDLPDHPLHLILTMKKIQGLSL